VPEKGAQVQLHAGLRYEYNTTATDIRGLWRSLSFTHLENGYPTLVPNIRSPYSFYTPDKKLFQPRLGIAYRLSEKTVIRQRCALPSNPRRVVQPG